MVIAVNNLIGIDARVELKVTYSTLQGLPYRLKSGFRIAESSAPVAKQLVMASE